MCRPTPESQGGATMQVVFETGPDIVMLSWAFAAVGGGRR